MEFDDVPSRDCDCICPSCNGDANYTFEGWATCTECGYIISPDEILLIQESINEVRQAIEFGTDLLDLGEITQDEYDNTLQNLLDDAQIDELDDPDLEDEDIEGYD